MNTSTTQLLDGPRDRTTSTTSRSRCTSRAAAWRPPPAYATVRAGTTLDLAHHAAARRGLEPVKAGPDRSGPPAREHGTDGTEAPCSSRDNRRSCVAEQPDPAVKDAAVSGRSGLFHDQTPRAVRPG
ncbi:hypothetical protein [Streptomyces sp. NPDC055186]